MTPFKHRVAAALSPAARTYVRYGRGLPGRETFFRRFSWVAQQGQTRTRYGFRMSFDSADFIRRNIHWFGVWEPTISDFVSARLQHDDCFVDVGSNAGYFSLLAASLIGPQGRVLAIDASTDMGDLLMANLALNGFDNVQFVHGAVSREPGELTLYPGTPGNTGQASVVMNLTGAAGVRVPAAPIGHWVPREIWQRARIIKVDIEGAEGHFIAGLGDDLAQLRTDCEILMELAPAALLDTGVSVQHLIETMSHAGFHAYQIENRYDHAFYAQPTRELRLPRLTEPPNEVMDVVFSRVDADYLPLRPA